MIDERIEILINRKLDGELSEEDSLELNKLLIRNPDAHALLDEYAVMDRLAAEAIEAELAEPVARVSPEQVSQWNKSKRQWWYSMALISAVAAALTLSVLLSQRAANMNDSAALPISGVHSAQQAAATLTDRAPQGRLVNVGTIPLDGRRRQTDSLERDVLGVWDQDSHSLYLLEANEARSTVEPVKFNY